MIAKHANPFLAHLGEDQRSFAEIAWCWARAASDKPDTMMTAFIKSFWEGAFEHDGRSKVFALLQPDSPSFERRPGNYAAQARGLIVKVGNNLHSYLTADRRESEIFRRKVAEVLCGMPEYCPWSWDGSDEGLLALSTIPFAQWPPQMREERYAEWRIRREDLAKWYETSTLVVAADLNQFWPALKGRDEPLDVRSNKMRRSFMKISEAVDAELADGGRLDGLRPGERRKRLTDRMIKLGLKSGEIPHERTFREFFNERPGKSEKSG
jgi:hypothetical protein